MQTRACMTPPALKIWENGSIIKEIVQTCKKKLLITAKLLNFMFFVYCLRPSFQREKTNVTTVA